VGILDFLSYKLLFGHLACIFVGDFDHGSLIRKGLESPEVNPPPPFGFGTFGFRMVRKQALIN
jgi:hypothetical protein